MILNSSMDGINYSYSYGYNNKMLVIMIHGFGVDMDEKGNYVKLAKELLDNDIDSIRFDLIGHGDSNGRSEDLTIDKALNIVDSFVNKYPHEKVSLVGTSYGGGVACIYSWNHNVDRIVLWSPLLDSYHNVIEPENHFCKEFLGNEALKRIKKDGYSIFGVDGLRINMNVFNDAKKYPTAIKSVMNVNKILLLHGDKDLLVPYEQSLRVSSINSKIELQIIENGTHCFYDNTINNVIIKTVEFLKGE